MLLAAITAAAVVFTGPVATGRLTRSRAVLLGTQQPICAPTAGEFPWWSDKCGALIADLDSRGGSRFGSRFA